MAADITRIFAILFLMIGPFKIIGPFTKLTLGADPALSNQIAIRAIIISSIALLLAALLGEKLLSNYGIPVPILSLAGGIIFFLVAIQNVIKQFSWRAEQEEVKQVPTLKLAMYPLAFPTIVTPYGIAAVIVFLALTPDLKGRLLIGAVVLGIMVLNLVMMLLNRYIYKVLFLVLPILGAILGVVQVALGLWIIYKSFLQLPKVA